jgi:hypothetical protein
MYKANFQPKLVASLLALSIAALLPLVNASAESLTTVNSSDKKVSADFSKLVKTVLATGGDAEIKKHLAPVIGLDKPSPTKFKENELNVTSSSSELKSCYVILDQPTDKKPKCVYLAWMKRAAGKTETQYYRISLSGQLEKSVTTFGNYDETGKQIRGSGKKVERDINSPEVKKEFDAEMAYWLKDWLEKEQKAASTKKQAAVVKPATAAAL